jgi:hypothetical protein
MSYPYLSECVVAGECRLGIVNDDGGWRMAWRLAGPPPPRTICELARIHTQATPPSCPAAGPSEREASRCGQVTTASGHPLRPRWLNE